MVRLVSLIDVNCNPRYSDPRGIDFLCFGDTGIKVRNEMKKKTWLAIAGLCLSALPVVSAEAAQYTGAPIKLTNVSGGGGYTVMLSGVSSPCSTGGYYIPQSATTSYSEMVSLASLAYSMGKIVNLTTDAAQTCVNGYVVLVGVQINN